MSPPWGIPSQSGPHPGADEPRPFGLDDARPFADDVVEMIGHLAEGIGERFGPGRIVVGEPALEERGRSDREILAIAMPGDLESALVEA